MEENNKILESDEEFKKYNAILDSPFEKGTTVEYNGKNKKYEGFVVDRLYEGRGILHESGQMIYSGFFKRGRFEGFGRKYRENKLIYEGYFHDGRYHGIGIIYINGEKVSKRMYKSGEPSSEGYGVLYDGNKETYSGILKYGKPKEGKGLTIYDEKGNKIYKGDFLDFKYHGEGTLYFEKSNDKYFCGNFDNGNYIKGQLYDLEGKITYEGNFINNIPVEGKNIKLYTLYKSLKYEGDISNCKYNGNGRLYKYEKLFYEGQFKDGAFNGLGKIYKIFNMNYLYYQGNFVNNEIIGNGIKYYKNGKKYIEGDFEFKNKNKDFDFYFEKTYAKGILYDYDGNILCETEIINFIPKEGKNIKLYANDEYLLYEGDIYDYKYQGKAKLYEEDTKYGSYVQDRYRLKYEGEFNQNVFEGHGKLYRKFYDYLYYEGYFVKGEIFGKGIRFYKSGKKKIEGVFEENNISKGKYYDPNGKVIYEGEIINDLFYKSDYIELYNDNGILLYKNKIEKIENREDFYNNFSLLKDVFLCRENTLNNYYIDLKLDKPSTKISFIAENYAGKTSLVRRFKNNEFLEGQINTIFTPDFEKYDYIYNNINYKLTINNLHGMEKFHFIKIQYLKSSNIIIYVIDVSELGNNINETYLNDLFENSTKDYKFIYLVLTKIDICKNDIEPYRKQAQKLIVDGMIFRYFEVSSKTGEGIESFVNCLKFDIDLSLKLDIKIKDKNHLKKKKSNKCLIS